VPSLLEHLHRKLFKEAVQYLLDIISDSTVTYRQQEVVIFFKVGRARKESGMTRSPLSSRNAPFPIKFRALSPALKGK